MRTPYLRQIANYLYEVKSTIKFNKPVKRVGKAKYVDKYTLSFVTLYGHDTRVGDDYVLRIAKQNIMKKFGRSGGTLVKIEITNVYT
jgi:hypothetical protein